MTLSYAKCLRKDVRVVAGADEGALGADRFFCYVYSQRGDQEHGVYMDDTQADEREYMNACHSLARLKRSRFGLQHILLYKISA